MGTIEKMRKYIALTKKAYNPRYDISVEEWKTLASECGRLEAVSLAFQYGRAKGYREGCLHGYKSEV